MIELVYSPKWFYGRDITIDSISVFVIILITSFVIQYYKISKNKKYLFLVMGFLLLALSFLAKIMMNFTVYSERIDTVNAGFAEFTVRRIVSSDNMFFFGFLIYRILTLLGLYAIYSVYNKQGYQDMLFVAFLLLILTYFSQDSYYAFHLTSLVLFMLITLQFYKVYRKTKHPASMYLTFSFFILTLSQLMFIFIKLNNICYVIAEIIQLIGYIFLLLCFIMVLRHGKKKNKS